MKLKINSNFITINPVKNEEIAAGICYEIDTRNKSFDFVIGFIFFRYDLEIEILKGGDDDCN